MYLNTNWLTHVSTPEEVRVLGETELLQLLLAHLVELTTKMLLDLLEYSGNCLIHCMYM
jgi:hypothetical protein